MSKISFQISVLALGIVLLTILIFNYDPLRPSPDPTVSNLQELLTAQGFPGRGTPTPPTSPAPPCNEYNDPVVTPCNPNIFYAVGPDREGVFYGEQTLKQIAESAVSSLGYSLSKFDCSGRPGTEDKCPLAYLAASLRSARTVIWEAHGGEDGSFSAVCKNDIVFGPSCCNAAKEVAINLGLSTDGLNCERQQPNPYYRYSDNTGTIIAKTSGPNLGCYIGGPVNRCMISIGPEIYNYLGSKAIVVSSSCYAGICGTESANSVLDFASGGEFEVSSVQFRHDAPVLKNDLIGQNITALTCLLNAPDPTIVNGPFCVSSFQKQELRGLDFRSVQQSLESRGHAGGAGWNDSFNTANGNEGYWSMGARGNPYVAVELSPTYQTFGGTVYGYGQPSTYDPTTGEVVLNTTSWVRAITTSQLKISSNPAGTGSFYTNFRFAATGANAGRQLTFKLTNLPPGYELMSREEWESMRARDRKEWGEYLLIEIKNLQTAQSGIKFAGNVRADRLTNTLRSWPLWIWADGLTTLSFPSMDWVTDQAGQLQAGHAKFSGPLEGGKLAFKIPIIESEIACVTEALADNPGQEICYLDEIEGGSATFLDGQPGCGYWQDHPEACLLVNRGEEAVDWDWFHLEPDSCFPMEPCDGYGNGPRPTCAYNVGQNHPYCADVDTQRCPCGRSGQCLTTRGNLRQCRIQTNIIPGSFGPSPTIQPGTTNPSITPIGGIKKN